MPSSQTPVALASAPSASDAYENEQFEALDDDNEEDTNRQHPDASAIVERFRPARASIAANDDGAARVSHPPRGRSGGVTKRKRRPTGPLPHKAKAEDETAAGPGEETLGPAHADKLAAAEAVPPRQRKDEDPFAWKHHHTLFPVANKLLAKRWDDLTRENHQGKLHRAQRSIDDDAPPRYAHLETKPKKKQMESERQADIARTNKLLVERMAYLTKTETIAGLQKEFDMRIMLVKQRHELGRKLANERIQQENKSVLQRLESSRSDYDHVESQLETVRHLMYIRNISTYPTQYEPVISIEKERARKVKAEAGKHQRAPQAFHLTYGSDVTRPVHAFGFAGSKVRINADGTFATVGGSGKRRGKGKKRQGRQSAVEAVAPAKPATPVLPPIPKSSGGRLSREKSPLDRTENVPIADFPEET
ncbi:hypothetical protein DFJ73DRAFT_844920 [Zopfochytrium polystomum]|nr:hypothetical protein DFJ73DRAFT_844920 [Zopfochytrium polystomum]